MNIAKGNVDQTVAHRLNPVLIAGIIQIVTQGVTACEAFLLIVKIEGIVAVAMCVRKNRAVRFVGRVFPWRTSLAPTDGSETRGFRMHVCDLASDRQGYFVKRPRKNTRTQQITA